jgi:integrase
MVWLPEHTGKFLDYLDAAGERLSPLFITTAFCGLRRDEALGLEWTQVDLDQAIMYVLETGGGEGTKSDTSLRVVPIPAPALEALRAWRERQETEREQVGADWRTPASSSPRGTAAPCSARQ